MSIRELGAILHRHPVVLAAVVIWSLIWKGLALWRAARAQQPAWFVVLLVVNTAGLLEIAYLLFFAPRVSTQPPRAGATSA
jgi:methionyl-tRNA synthetase